MIWLRTRASAEVALTMPYRLAHHDHDNQLFFIGRCPTKTLGQARYVIISIRGRFTLREALPFLAISKAKGTVPFYGHFFPNSVYMHSMFMDIDLPMGKQHKKIKYYIDNYDVPLLISQYEWNICRHDVHQFVAPTDRTRKVFGDYMTPAEQAQALQENDLLQVVRISRP